MLTFIFALQSRLCPNRDQTKKECFIPEERYRTVSSVSMKVKILILTWDVILDLENHLQTFFKKSFKNRNESSTVSQYRNLILKGREDPACAENNNGQIQTSAYLKQQKSASSVLPQP
jgi:hypothetical protein